MKDSGYVVKAACKGYRPSRVLPKTGRTRSRLIARLAKDRSIARFIVAPSGYGKTYLALDYAETMFNWTHVFWFNAQSPCLIRDLDDGDLLSECFARDPSVKLVIFDNLPLLSPQRVVAFAQMIDEFLERECEVIITCVPTCDLLGSLQLDRIRIGASDLLVDDEELDMLRSDEERLQTPSNQVPAARRVPALAWNRTELAVNDFAFKTLSEELPSDILLCMSSAYVLRKGRLSRLMALGSVNREHLQDVMVDYPHLGFDWDANYFEAPSINLDAMNRPIKGLLTNIVEQSAFQTRSELVRVWADTLLVQEGQADRACDVMRTLASVEGRMSWLITHRRTLAQSGCFFAWLCLIKSLSNARAEERSRVVADEALCYRMLGDTKSALRLAKRLTSGEDQRDGSYVIGLMLLQLHGSGILSDQATQKLTEYLDGVHERASKSKRASKQDAWWVSLAQICLARRHGIEELCALWDALYQQQADPDMLCVAASWLFSLVKDRYIEKVSLDHDLWASAEKYVHTRLTQNESNNFFVTSAGLSLEHAHELGMPLRYGSFDAAVLLDLRQHELRALTQQRQFEAFQQENVSAKQIYASQKAVLATQPLSFTLAEQRRIPLLELRLFGMLEASIDGKPINPKLFSRQAMRVLLVLLAAYQGRDLSRDSVVESMWPNRSPELGNKNFYSVWNQLKRALTLSDGTCPYLIRQQYGCRLESRYVRTDIKRLEDICRELLFGPFDPKGWITLYTEIDRDFSSDLLPSERKNPLIKQIRRRYSTRLVDALVAAALRFETENSAENGIWFARLALSHDKTREDAHVALMRCQMSAGQRTAAIMTYHDCRAVLADELGIDPSPETKALYESLLGDA